MADNRRLTTNFKANLGTNYRRVENIPGNEPKDNINYNDCQFNLTDGSGLNRADIQHRSTRNLINSTEIIDLDGDLTNEFGDTLNYDAVKLIMLRNRETDQFRILEYRFKDETGYIGAQGFRILGEPGSKGIQAIVSSTSAEEGALTISSNADITYDLIIVGSTAESSG